jgi:hypothetical protein
MNNFLISLGTESLDLGLGMVYTIRIRILLENK